MRRCNAILSMVILLLFVIHAILGAYSMLGFSSLRLPILSWLLLVLVVIHLVIGTILTVQTLQAQAKAGVSYPRENKLFWARRISGFAIMFFILFHVLAFSGVTASNFRLPEFTGLKLATQLLMVGSIGVHVITNASPMLIALGIERLKPRAHDIAFWISVLLLLTAAAFIVYFLRWHAV